MPIETVWTGRATDLGGFSVSRVLPHARRPMVGPFIFVDHMGPAEFAPGHGIDVRPHPHIGLATVTYLFEGEFLHRDSLGNEQIVRPGDVNWMVAGRGIVHSERTPMALRLAGSRAHGVQTWVALPDAHEDMPPRFEHHPAAALPRFNAEGAAVTVIVGEAFGRRAPAQVLSPTLYCALELAPGARLRVPAEHPERAVYVLSGALTIDQVPVEAGTAALLAPGVEAQLTVPHEAATPVRAMLLGGAPVGPRLIRWNFVASTRERIAAAEADWARYVPGVGGGARFPAVPGETEFIPLPAA